MNHRIYATLVSLTRVYIVYLIFPYRFTIHLPGFVFTFFCYPRGHFKNPTIFYAFPIYSSKKRI